MGGDRVKTELDNCDEFCRDPIVWHIYMEGGFVPLLESLVGHDEKMSAHFVGSWRERRVTMGGISFEVNEEVISKVTGLSCDGKKYKKYKKHTKTQDLESLNTFFRDNEK